MRYLVYRAAFELLSLTGLSALIRAISPSKGVIFTLHRVMPQNPRAFSPNAILQVKPAFLEHMIVKARKLGYDIVDLDEAVRRINTAGKTRKFVVFTFDDAYRDNLVNALPILKKHDCPFTIFVPTAFVDGLGEVWWQALEDVISAQKAIAVDLGEGLEYLDCASLAQKNEVYYRLYWHMRDVSEPDRVAFIKDLAAKYGLDLKAHCKSLVMNWQELQEIAAEPLCTIGAHTVNHYELSKLPPDQMREEIAQSVSVLEAQFGERPRHFSYPIGASRSAAAREFATVKSLGLTSAVTTRPGGLYHDHTDHLEALPRVSLNGNFQAKRFAGTYLTGALFTIIAGGERVSAK
ncbi:polysaccharide deacetylase family protein [Cucumibacter marinus]|uniref:polysaccharide deacetylase family protein n=1 Tax=Cucumibacter marinus TaxID=1121252 RepID=UPI0003F54AB2|nr:polysaccharide deacetylase family protein [Cucumibacter marinus]